MNKLQPPITDIINQSIDSFLLSHYYASQSVLGQCPRQPLLAKVTSGSLMLLLLLANFSSGKYPFCSRGGRTWHLQTQIYLPPCRIGTSSLILRCLRWLIDSGTQQPSPVVISVLKFKHLRSLLGQADFEHLQNYAGAQSFPLPTLIPPLTP